MDKYNNLLNLGIMCLANSSRWQTPTCNGDFSIRAALPPYHPHSIRHLAHSRIPRPSEKSSEQSTVVADRAVEMRLKKPFEHDVSVRQRPSENCRVRRRRERGARKNVGRWPDGILRRLGWQALVSSMSDAVAGTAPRTRGAAARRRAADLSAVGQSVAVNGNDTAGEEKTVAFRSV